MNNNTRNMWIACGIMWASNLAGWAMLRSPFYWYITTIWLLSVIAWCIFAYRVYRERHQ